MHGYCVENEVSTEVRCGDSLPVGMLVCVPLDSLMGLANVCTKEP